MPHLNFNLPSPLQKLESNFLEKHKVHLYLKRDDLIHPQVSGNKWRKLKFNVEEAKKQKKNTILTFGGAYSNHIVATAFAAQACGLNSIGVIRGDEFDTLNQSLAMAKEAGMKLHFVSRSEYGLKTEADFIDKLKHEFGDFYLVPEGGANALGVRGCEEIVEEIDIRADYVALSAGTGTTAAGVLNVFDERVLVFPVLKGGEGLEKDILTWQLNSDKATQLTMQAGFHFGGYARLNSSLVEFANNFYQVYQIPLDLVYTAKLMYGLFKLIEDNYFVEGSSIVAIHTGGLQGNKGMVKRYGLHLDYG
jgi:1-aminocyclopropane-1-carboxylate deaminase/D-cysteine desulfhydrase-like pyridoxal-dependent ACC family enzyme